MERNSHRSCELQICDNYSTNNGNYTKFFALDQEEKIIEAARILNSFGKQFLHGQTLPDEIYYSASYEYSSEFQSVVETVDGLIEWLERSGNDAVENLKKKEAILRGVLRLTGKLEMFLCLELNTRILIHKKKQNPKNKDILQFKV